MSIALVARLHGLGAPNLWLDEANSWYVAHLSWSGLLRNLRTSPVGPVYFVVLKLWMTVAGESEVALRAPSLICSVLLIPLVYALGARTVSHRAALVAAALTALSPLHLYFAQEARMYMPLALLAAATALAYVQWRDSITCADAGAPSGDHRALSLYAVLAAAMLGTNVVSAPLLVALNIDAFLVLWRDLPSAAARRHHVVAWVGANAAVAGAIIAFGLLLNPHGAAASQAWRGPLGIAGAARALLGYPVSAIHGVYYYPDELARSLAGLRGAPGIATARHLLSLIIAQPLVVAALVVVLARAAAAAGRPRARVLALALIAPIVVGAAISVRQQLDLSRYFLYASTFLYLLIGAGIARMSRLSGIIALVCMGAAIAEGTVRTFRVGARDSDYRVVARDLVARRADVGAVLLQPTEMVEPLTYYLHGKLHLPIRTVAKQAPLGPALARMSNGPVWLVLDYRSPAYAYSPDMLRTALGACIVRDQYDDAGGSGVRLVLVRPAADCGQACTTCQ
ncbi:MAG TPA: glycosyltransferase family 39 protein [Gemmatimonadaceae bacterium]|jgi:hypothetical protein